MAISIFGFGQPVRLLLENNPGATGAYSLRKLSGIYSGPAVRVRRSSDNAETDIGFSDKDFNMSAFNAFVGGGTGYVVTFYDQSGNGNHLTQSSASDQHYIVSSSGLTSTRPHLESVAGRAGGYFKSGFNVSNRTFTFATVMRSTHMYYTSLLSSTQSPNYSYLTFTTDGIYVSWGNGGGVSQGFTLAGGVEPYLQKLVAAVRGDGESTRRFYNRGTQNSFGASQSNNTSNISISGGYGYFIGNWADFIFWNNTVLTNTQIAAIAAEQIAYYGV